MNFKSKLYWYYSKLLLGQNFSFTELAPEFFILSAGRSGSTLLRKLLMQGGEVHIPPESNNWIPAILVYFSKYHFKSWKFKVNVCLNHIFKDEAFQYWKLDHQKVSNELLKLPKDQQNARGFIHTIYRLHALQHNTDHGIIGDKTPYLALHIPWLKIYNPKAKYIYLKRDPRAVVASRMKAFDESIEAATNRWIDTINQVEKSKSVTKENYYELNYEDLVTHPDQELRKICKFLQIRYSNSMIENKNLELGDTILEHHTEIQNPIQQFSLEKWKEELSREEINYIHKRINTSIKE